MKPIKSIFCDVEYVYDRQPKTNVPHVYGHANFHTWGYLGQGPTDFSANILNYFTDGDKNFVDKFCLDFVHEVISKLDVKASGKIPAKFIHNWIKNKKTNKINPKHQSLKLPKNNSVYWCITQQNSRR